MASVSISGDVSGAISIAAPSAAGSGVLTLPTGTDTLIGKATTDTLTNKSIAATQLTGVVAVANGGTGVTASKQLLQNLNFTTGALATGTTVIPQDDTIPQITEGNEYMTLAITPTSATSTLEIQVNVMISNSATVDKCTALFRDAVANALAATYVQNRIEGGDNMVLNHVMTSGTTSTITFRVRSGANTGTNTFNGRTGVRWFGGVLSSFITIKEYAA